MALSADNGFATREELFRLLPANYDVKAITCNSAREILFNSAKCKLAEFRFDAPGDLRSKVSVFDGSNK
jgi:hypothetical protein